MSLDTTLFFSLYSLSHHSAFTDALGVFLGDYLAYVWGLVFLIVAFWPHVHQARIRIALVVSVVAGLIARLGIKTVILFVYPHPRPFMILQNIHPLIATSAVENFQSFPSGHTIFFFAIATVLFFFHKKIGVFALLIAALIGVARIYAGIHWPSDIAGGALLGVLTGWFTYIYYSHHAHRIDTLITQAFDFIKK